MAARIPIELVNTMYAYYREGHTLRETEHRYGLGFRSIAGVFKRHGLPVRTQRHAIMKHHDTRAETLLMYADYVAGMTQEQIATKYHYDESTVYKRFERHGLKARRTWETRLLTQKLRRVA